MTEVLFYYSIGSRYSYLAASRLEALARETGCTFVWRPVNGPRLIARRADDPFANPAATGQYTPDYRARDVARWANHYGIPFVEPTGRVHFDSQQIALACTAALGLGAVEAVSRGLYAAMYDGGGETEIDGDSCVRIAEACGLQPGWFASEMAAESTRERLDATIDEAVAAGVFGVPSFVVGDDLFWGNDRLVLLRDRLMAGVAH